MSRSAQTPGRSSLRTPSRSIRCPPVILIIGISYLSATSAIRRSCSAFVTPPLICGTTENVPSRWMLACTRSLMNRASRSSTYSPPHIILSSDARPILLLASSSPPGTSLANTDETDFSSCVRMAAISSGFGIGTPGTYQLALGSSSTAPPAAHSTICATRPLQVPQPLPALVQSMTPLTVLQPSCTQAAIVPLVTPLQLQTCAS